MIAGTNAATLIAYAINPASANTDIGPTCVLPWLPAAATTSPIAKAATMPRIEVRCVLAAAMPCTVDNECAESCAVLRADCQTAHVTLIAIDGPTGVGKSTTAHAVADALGATLILDPVSVSPLLDDYYTGEATPAAALEAELAFLHSRASLLAGPDSCGGDLVVSDFSVMRTAPFAEFLDSHRDYATVLSAMYATMRTGRRPDVLVLLTGPPTALLSRVRTRDRSAEVDLTIEHLDALQAHFTMWRSHILRQAPKSFVVDTGEWDPRRPDDLDDLVLRLRAAIHPA